MRHAIIIIFLTITSVGTLFAQKTTGFSDPDDIQQLLDYRLPDWGYSNFLLNFSSDGEFINSLDIRPDRDIERQSRTVQFYLNPKHELYRESENRIFSLSSNLFLDYETDKDEQKNEDQAQKDRTWNSELNIAAELREYVSSNTFLLAQEDISFRLNSSSQEETLNESLIQEEDQFRRNFSSATRVGVGMGRVRNVNPMIRALRLKERYGVLANNELDDAEVRNAADVFTRYDGYQRRYDRPEKYFWQAMDEAVNTSISSLEPFDLFYLADVLDENTGRRLEGWEISGGGSFSYHNNLHRIEDSFETPSLDRSRNIQKQAGIFVNTRWYKNLSLNHQLEFTADVSRDYPLDSDAIVKWDTQLMAGASWLWNVTDRFLLDTRLINRYNSSKLGGIEYIIKHRRWGNATLLSSDFIYFIENRLAFNIGARYDLVYRGNTETESSFHQRNMGLRFNAGIKYYFSRNLY